MRKTSRKIKCSNKTIEVNIDNKYLIKITDQGANLVAIPTNMYMFQSHKNEWIQNTYQHDHKFIEEIAFNNHPVDSIPYIIVGQILRAINDNPDKRCEFLLNIRLSYQNNNNINCINTRMLQMWNYCLFMLVLLQGTQINNWFKTHRNSNV